ncbi:hypothetical protein DFH09DRAFT_1094476 [Mycena vulgaris]|nr:hypothetical protein DFH09DRAFT_1094476 [Mycena vulgaris]
MIMKSSAILWALALSFRSVRAAVQPAPSNLTIDDRAPAVNYTPAAPARCPSATCPASLAGTLFNGTSTLTNGSISVDFTGNALFVFLGASGACTFVLNGAPAVSYNDTSADDTSADNIRAAYTKPAIPFGPHTLTIAPAAAGVSIQLDYIVYTAASPVPKKKKNVGAIVGGVVVAVVILVALAMLAVLFLRRRRRLRKGNVAGGEKAVLAQS